jgi:hypothetical protein
MEQWVTLFKELGLTPTLLDMEPTCFIGIMFPLMMFGHLGNPQILRRDLIKFMFSFLQRMQPLTVLYTISGKVAAITMG